MTAFVWLGAVLVGLWVLGIALSRHIQGLALLLSGSSRVATVLYDVLVLPGVVLHELSHVLVALLLGIRVISVNLFQFRARGDARQGEIVVARADPLRMSLVGAAPLFGGLGVLLLLVRLIDPPVLSLHLAALVQIGALLSHWSTALGLYLLFAVGNTMFPSEADRRAWWVVGGAIGVLLLVLLAFDVRPALPPSWFATLAAQAERLAAALLPVIVVDLCFLLVVLLAEAVVSKLRGRRVVYRPSKS